MKIGIMTWYKELNHGAFLQAYASMCILKQLGLNPCFIDYKRQITQNLGFFQTSIKRVKRLFSGDYFLKREYDLFNHEKNRKFALFREKVFTNVSSAEDHFSCVMVGSDMVFSLIQGFSPYMFGIGIDTDYLFSYAACSGGTSYHLIKKMGLEKTIRDGLRSFQAIGCRDKETAGFVKAVCPEISTVDTIDPALLYGFSQEKEKWNSKKWKESKPYLLVYSYHGDMNTRKEIKQIKKYAERNGLKIVSCGYYHPWCDESVNCDPAEFVEMFANAQAIVTDTFHGTVFSIIFKKRFCSIVRGNAYKLTNLLNKCGLADRIGNRNKSIISILNSSLDFEACDEWLAKERIKSLEYLADNIRKAKETEE